MLRGAEVTPAAKRTQGANRPCDRASKLNSLAGADAVLGSEGSMSTLKWPDVSHPTGVKEHGMFAWGSPGNLGDPDTSRSERAGTDGRSNEAHRKGVGKSEHLHSTAEVGEPNSREPAEGRRVSDHGTAGEKGGWELRVSATPQQNSNG